MSPRARALELMQSIPARGLLTEISGSPFPAGSRAAQWVTLDPTSKFAYMKRWRAHMDYAVDPGTAH